MTDHQVAAPLATRWQQQAAPLVTRWHDWSPGGSTTGHQVAAVGSTTDHQVAAQMSQHITMTSEHAYGRSILAQASSHSSHVMKQSYAFRNSAYPLATRMGIRSVTDNARWFVPSAPDGAAGAGWPSSPWSHRHSPVVCTPPPPSAVTHGTPSYITSHTRGRHTTDEADTWSSAYKGFSQAWFILYSVMIKLFWKILILFWQFLLNIFNWIYWKITVK